MYAIRSYYDYLFARYAPQHPELFFHHWAKPLFVLLSCPFAQFGFIGVKVFNFIVSLLIIVGTYLICKEMKIKQAIVASFILMSRITSYNVCYTKLLRYVILFGVTYVTECLFAYWKLFSFLHNHCFAQK